MMSLSISVVLLLSILQRMIKSSDICVFPSSEHSVNTVILLMSSTLGIECSLYTTIILQVLSTDVMHHLSTQICPLLLG